MADAQQQLLCIAHKCLKPDAKYCTRCRVATYCSTSCQRSDYNNHSTFCKYVAKTRELYPDNPLCSDKYFLVLMYSVQSVALAMYNTRAMRRKDHERLTLILNAVDEKAHDAVKKEAVRALATYEEHGKAIGEEVANQASRILTLTRVFYEHSPLAHDTPLDKLNAMFVAATRELDPHIHVMLVACVPPPTFVSSPPTLFGQPRPFACSAILTASTRAFADRLKAIPGLEDREISGALAVNQERLRNETGFLSNHASGPTVAETSGVLAVQSVATVPGRASARAKYKAVVAEVSMTGDTDFSVSYETPPPPPPTTPPPEYTEPDEPEPEPVPSTHEMQLPPFMAGAKSMIGLPVLRDHTGPVIGRVAQATTDADGKTTVVIEPPIV